MPRHPIFSLCIVDFLLASRSKVTTAQQKYIFFFEKLWNFRQIHLVSLYKECQDTQYFPLHSWFLAGISEQGDNSTINFLLQKKNPSVEFSTDVTLPRLQIRNTCWQFIGETCLHRKPIAPQLSYQCRVSTRWCRRWTIRFETTTRGARRREPWKWTYPVCACISKMDRASKSVPSPTCASCTRHLLTCPRKTAANSHKL